MTTFIKNEFIKIKSEKFLLVILILMLIPFGMNFANFIINDKNLSLSDGFYFRFYNQYFMLLPIISCIIASSVYYIEYKNNTFTNWFSYSTSRQLLFFSKGIVSLLLSLFYSIINLLIILIFYIINGRPVSEILAITFSFSIVNLIVILLVNFFSIAIINITKNIIVSIVSGIIISMVSMIFMAAPFSYVIPTTFGYRLGLVFIDSSLYYPNVLYTIIVGCSISILLFALLLFIAYKSLIYKKI